MVTAVLEPGASGVRSNVWVLTIGVLEVYLELDSAWDGLWRPGEASFQIGTKWVYMGKGLNRNPFVFTANWYFIYYAIFRKGDWDSQTSFSCNDRFITWPLTGELWKLLSLLFAKKAKRKWDSKITDWCDRKYKKICNACRIKIKALERKEMAPSDKMIAWNLLSVRKTWSVL